MLSTKVLFIKDYSVYAGRLNAISEENLNTDTIYYNADDVYYNADDDSNDEA